jgi:hypothetical protein
VHEARAQEAHPLHNAEDERRITGEGRLPDRGDSAMVDASTRNRGLVSAMNQVEIKLDSDYFTDAGRRKWGGNPLTKVLPPDWEEAVARGRLTVMWLPKTDPDTPVARCDFAARDDGSWDCSLSQVDPRSFPHRDG